MHIESNIYCPLVRSLESEIPHPESSGFGMTFNFFSGEGRVGDSFDESPTLPSIQPIVLSFRALARNLSHRNKIYQGLLIIFCLRITVFFVILIARKSGII